MNTNLLLSLIGACAIVAALVYFGTSWFRNSGLEIHAHPTQADALLAASHEANQYPDAELIGRAGTGSNNWPGNHMGTHGAFVVRPVPFETLEVGNFVGFRVLLHSEDGTPYEGTVVHRIREGTPRKGFLTQGDANTEPDPDLLTRDTYLWRVVSLHTCPPPS